MLQCTSPISHNTRTSPISHNMPFCIRNVHISVTKWCIVGYGNGALWDLWDGCANVTHIEWTTLSCTSSGLFGGLTNTFQDWFNILLYVWQLGVYHRITRLLCKYVTVYISMSLYRYRDSHWGDKMAQKIISFNVWSKFVISELCALFNCDLSIPYWWLSARLQ